MTNKFSIKEKIFEVIKNKFFYLNFRIYMIFIVSITSLYKILPYMAINNAINIEKLIGEEYVYMRAFLFVVSNISFLMIFITVMIFLTKNFNKNEDLIEKHKNVDYELRQYENLKEYAKHLGKEQEIEFFKKRVDFLFDSNKNNDRKD